MNAPEASVAQRDGSPVGDATAGADGIGMETGVPADAASTGTVDSSPRGEGARSAAPAGPAEDDESGGVLAALGTRVRLASRQRKAIGAALQGRAHWLERTAQLEYERALDAAADEELAREDASGERSGGWFVRGRGWVVENRLLVGAVVIALACAAIAVVGQVSFYLSLPMLPVIVAWMFPLGVEAISWWNGAAAAMCVRKDLPSAKYTRRMWLFASFAAAINAYHGIVHVGDWSVGVLMGLASLFGPLVWHSYTGVMRAARSNRTYEDLKVAAKRRVLSPVISYRADRIEVLIGAQRELAWQLAQGLMVRDVRVLVREVVRRRIELVRPDVAAVLSWRRRENAASADGDGRRWRRARRTRGGAPADEATATPLDRDLATVEDRGADRERERESGVVRERESREPGLDDGSSRPFVSSRSSASDVERAHRVHGNGAMQPGQRESRDGVSDPAPLTNVLELLDIGPDLQRDWERILGQEFTTNSAGQEERETVNGGASHEGVNHGTTPPQREREREPAGTGRRTAGRESRARRRRAIHAVSVNARIGRERESSGEPSDRDKVIDEVRRCVSNGADLGRLTPISVARSVFGEEDAPAKRSHVSLILKELREAKPAQP